MRRLPVLIALSLLTVSAPFAAAQDFYGSRPWLPPSNVLRTHSEQSVDGDLGINLSPPKVHFLLGHLRPIRQSAVRPRINQSFSSHIQHVYVLPQRGHARWTPRHRRRQH
jgi:hypothetical protein